jgi:hypothetical protein
MMANAIEACKRGWFAYDMLARWKITESWLARKALSRRKSKS